MLIYLRKKMKEIQKNKRNLISSLFRSLYLPLFLSFYFTLQKKKKILLSYLSNLNLNQQFPIAIEN